MTEREAQQHRSYENYSATASSYDETRVPVGIDIIVHVLNQRGHRPEAARLLDAGCGTGSYLAALQDSVGELTGLELNPEMLARARHKLDRAPNVGLHEGTIVAMPFDGGSFDAVIVNQVLHHLDSGTSTGDTWPHLRQALAECRRVLRPGGVLLLNTCTHEQVRAGYWYVALIPQAAERLVQRYASIETLLQLLTDLDFEHGATLAPIDASFGGQRYLDPAGPFDPRWRNGDSIWSLVTDSELHAALSKLRALHDSGTAAAFVREHDQERQRIGQATFLPAWRH